MRIRTLFVAGLIAVGAIAPATAASADVCYDLYAELNGSAVIDESDCIATS